MRRREFISLLGSVAATYPLVARAQQSARQRRVGILIFSEDDKAIIRPFLQELARLGYVDGRTVAIEYRDAKAKYERLAAMADELVSLNPDVIFSFGGEQAPTVKAATTTIPIVVVVSNGPVESGHLLASSRQEPC